LALDRDGLSMPCPGHFTPGKEPDAHCTGGGVGPRADHDGCEKSQTHWDSIPDRPAQLCYLAHIVSIQAEIHLVNNFHFTSPLLHVIIIQWIFWRRNIQIWPQNFLLILSMLSKDCIINA